ncbi:SPFH domain-containing protein [Clostridium oryzae]|uniref:Double zinc ribbon n=1 Tax=Clostridium oryzae TaxID=1450648 RepID=A0A1V4IVX9_9CLOT|nr:SPFH domain-containing protein [Clostridium oryzae]OPJ64192.1 double zinc ribbon [Clostridium oryzae]
MGIFNIFKNQFIEVIEWTDSSSDTIVYRFPVENKEIKMGAQLTVRESQMAVFVNEGQIADVFGPGRYMLTTKNMPVLSTIRAWAYDFNSPFKAEVYFINTKQFTDQKWGTSNPIMMRDAEFGVIRLRAFGIFSFKVVDPGKFLKEVFGTTDVFDTENIVGQLKRALISGISDMIAESRIPALDLATHYDEFGESAKVKLQDRFQALGFELSSLYIENISLPEEVEKVLDKKTSMGVLGNMQQYTQYQAAEAIRDVAQNPCNGASGLGMSFGVGNAVGNIITDALNKNSQTTTSVQPTNTVTCPKCNAQVTAGSKFCSSCGNMLIKPTVKCIKCGSEIEEGLKFCPDCGAPQTVKDVFCKVCGKPVPAASKFCTECGNKIE